MGAETTVYVRVQKVYQDWIEVSAVTLAEAMSKATQQDGVICSLYATYDRPPDQEGVGE